MANADQSAPRTSRTPTNLYSDITERHAAGRFVRQAERPGRRPPGILQARICSKASPRRSSMRSRPIRPVRKDTAIFITFDEGGGYYDSGYVQPLDFFGDGTRIPLIVVSPYREGRPHLPRILRPRFDPEVHRAELGAEAGHRPQPRQLPEPGRAVQQSLRAGRTARRSATCSNYSTSPITIRSNQPRLQNNAPPARRGVFVFPATTRQPARVLHRS